MPLRVKCRCGQELVIRYSEWVYLAIGVSVGGFLVNAAAVLLLFSRLEQLESRLRPEADSRAAAPATTPEPGNAGSRDTPREEDAPKLAAGESSPTRPAPPAAPVAPPPEAGPGHVAAAKPEPEAPRPLRQAAEAELNVLAEIERQLETSRNGSEEPATAVAPFPPSPRALIPAPALVRLALLEAHPEDVPLVAAHLLDPDPRIRSAATELLSRAPPARLERHPWIEPIVEAARPLLSLAPEDVEVLDRIDTRAAENGSGSPDDLEGAWRRASELAAEALARTPLAGELERLLAEIKTRGADVLVALDTTRSMEVGLADFQAALARVLPVLEWGVPGLRLGWLLYKDEVTDSFDFSDSLQGESLSRVLALRAEGGGDVPEGVFSAVRAALELGRFSWRPEAVKHIVVIGDAPPKYSEVPALESLLRACHAQAAYRVHTIGMHPAEGESVPFFERFAAAGGGRSATCPPGRLELEILSIVFAASERSAELAARVDGAVREWFEKDG